MTLIETRLEASKLPKTTDNLFLFWKEKQFPMHGVNHN